MKFEAGDSVVVKHSNEDGKVIEIINDKMVLVEVRGVKFPAYTDQLDYPYFKMFSKAREAEKKPAKKYIDEVRKEKTAPKYKVAEGVWLLFFPVFNKDVFDDDVVESLKIYLVNQTDQAMRFQFWLRFKGSTGLELQNEVGALRDFYIMDIDFEDLNDNPVFDFEFSLVKPDKNKADYHEASFKPKAKQVFKQVEALKEKGEAFFSHQLFETFLSKPKQEPISAGSAVSATPLLDKLSAAGFVVKNSKKQIVEPPPPSVLDLHIEKLTDNYGNMTSGEKLDFQLRTFEKWIDKLQLHYVREATVIHGIGSGKLKDELHEMLKYRSGVKSFVQQYHPWYGNGATEIYFG